MGISRGTVRLLEMTLGGNLNRERAVTFGVQKVETGSTDQAVLFHRLGYRQVDSIDYYPDEGPTITLDLNRPVLVELLQCFDLVYDGGTLEHCFDPAQVLRNAASLTAPGGMVIHHVPINNWVDHGFYQFSPTLFFDFYGAAGFTELALKIHFMRGKRESYVVYDPARDPPVPYALGGRQRVLAFFSARRSDENLPPAPTSLIQGRYRATFGGESTGKRSGRKTLWQRLHASLRKRLINWSATPL